MEKRAIEALSVVSSVRFHAGDKTHKTGYHANLRCGCGAKQVGPIRISSKFPTLRDCLRELGQRIERDHGPTCIAAAQELQAAEKAAADGKNKGDCRHHARQGAHIDRKNHLGNASGSAPPSHLLQQGLGHGAHRHEDSAGCCDVSPR